MKRTYRAMQVTLPGTLEVVERETPAPGPGEVLIAVEACGADIGDIENADPARELPRVPGHEVVGRIAAIGAGVPSSWKPGQRVGVGRLGGHCNECTECRRGHFNLCRNQLVTGSSRDGGYAEMMLVRGTGLVSIPDELHAGEAAPILCAGIATFNALKKCGAEAGDLIAVLGIGGLGHMALQYARRMDFRVAAIGRGQDIAQDARNLGAHLYIDTNEENAAERLRSLGAAKAILTTIAAPAAVTSLIGGLAPQGRLVLLGVEKDPMPVLSGLLVSGERSIMGSITGSPYENERALDFSVLTGVRPMIEIMPLDKACDAYQRAKSGEIRFQMVLVMGENGHAPQR